MQLSANGIAFEVEEHGPADAEPLLLIMGLGMQLLGWPDGFVDALVQAGFRVVRFDNRDAGLSHAFDDAGVPNIALQALRHALRLRLRGPYTLADMAGDAVAVLDALDIDSAHVCGASMGGMVAQHVAARYLSRVRSLTLMMTSSGARRLPGPTWKVRSALLGKPANADDIEAVIRHYRRLFRIIGSPRYPTDEAVLADSVSRAVRRSYRPGGTARQLVAIAADGDRTPLLGSIRVPTMIVHGSADPMLPAASAVDLKSKIAGAEIDIVDGMGHDLPQALWPRFVADIRAVVRRAPRCAIRSDERKSAGKDRAPGSEI